MFNRCTLVGRVGKDPESRFLPDGSTVVTFSLATDEQWKDKSGEKVSKVEWHKIVAFRRLAEIISSYVTKGQLLLIEGKIQTRSWDDKEGKKRYTTEIVADTMKMLDSKRDGGGGGTQEPSAPKESDAPQEPMGGSDVPF